MPRMGRVVLPNYPLHVVQRGHDRQAVFVEDDDFSYYLANLEELSQACEVRVYGYCLMTNHVHLLLAPSTVAGIGWLMKGLAGRQTRYRNKLEGRRGTLWEGRYKSSLVDADNYLYACLRYIDLNPVRAHMVASPQSYPWSGCAERCGLDSGWLAPVPGMKPMAAADYRAYLRMGIPDGEWDLIREAVQRGQLTGEDRFVAQVESALGRRIERRGPGRPRK